MVDKPDLNKLKDKLDLGGILDNLKSMINPSSGTPDVDPDDDLGIKIAQASMLIKEMVKAQQTQVKQLNKLNELLNAIFVDIESVRKSKDQTEEKSEIKTDADKSHHEDKEGD